MSILPPGIAADDEIAIVWDMTGETLLVTASLGDARITVESATEESVELIPWLIASLPDIMNAAWDAIESQDQEDK